MVQTIFLKYYSVNFDIHFGIRYTNWIKAGKHIHIAKKVFIKSNNVKNLSNVGKFGTFLVILEPFSHDFSLFRYLQIKIQILQSKPNNLNVLSLVKLFISIFLFCFVLRFKWPVFKSFQFILRNRRQRLDSDENKYQRAWFTRAKSVLVWNRLLIKLIWGRRGIMYLT